MVSGSQGDDFAPEPCHTRQHPRPFGTGRGASIVAGGKRRGGETMSALVRLAGAALLAALAPVGAAAQEALTVAEARASLLGRWEGTFELLDEGTSESFEWPVAVSIEDAGDGSTYIE